MKAIRKLQPSPRRLVVVVVVVVVVVRVVRVVAVVGGAREGKVTP